MVSTLNSECVKWFQTEKSPALAKKQVDSVHKYDTEHLCGIMVRQMLHELPYVTV